MKSHLTYIFVTGLLCVFFFEANSQSLVVSDKKWVYLLAVDYPFPEIYSDLCYKIGNDTVVAGKDYKKLLASYGCNEMYSINGYIRETKEGEVYFLNNTILVEEEFLLYDFGMEVGDTVRNGSDNCSYVLDSVNTATDGKRLLYITEIPGHGDIWIENIGSKSGLLKEKLTGGSQIFTCCLLGNEQLYHHPNFEKCYFNASANFNVDAGKDTNYCKGFSATPMKLGTNVKIKNGVAPFTFAWKCKVPKGLNSFFTASDLLNDTTVISPKIEYAPSQRITFFLNVTDSFGNVAKDTINTSFSSCGCVTGYSVVFINNGDSIWLDAGKPYGRYERHYFEPSEGLSNPDSSGTWCKPDKTTSYSIVSVDTFGCICSCEAYEIRVGWDVPGSQFAPVGTEWYYTYRESMASVATGYYHLKSVKDTIIDSKKCKVLHKTLVKSNGKSSFIGSEYLHSDSIGNKVYRYKYDNFYLLYDFDRQKGDTIIVKEPFQDGSYDSIIMVVDSVGSEILNSVLFKFQYLRRINRDLSEMVFNEKVYERIGGLNYFFPINDLDCDGGCPQPLRCYKDGYFYLNLSAQHCNQLITSSNFTANSEFNIYPNPTINEITVSNPFNSKLIKIELKKVK